MKTTLAFLALLLAAALVRAQIGVSSVYNWPAVTGTGQDGQYINSSAVYPAENYTISWTTTGTAPSACTFRVEGSDDASAWTGLDATAPEADSLPCTSSNMISIAYKPTRYIRVYLVTYTPGDGTTSVVFHYTRGQQ